MRKILKPFTTKEQWLEYFEDVIANDPYDSEDYAINELLEEFDKDLYDINVKALGWDIEIPESPVLKETDKLNIELVERYLKDLKAYLASDYNKVLNDKKDYKKACENFYEAKWELVNIKSGFKELSLKKKELVTSFLLEYHNEARYSYKKTYVALCKIVELAK